MSDEINDFWDSRWSLPDPKIEKLRSSAQNTENLLRGHDNRLIDLERKVIELTEDVNELILSNRMLILVAKEKLTSDQFKNLIDMLNSVDEENHTVAHETINNLEDEH